ncbi:MAG: hypothetical protein ACTHNA_11700 [Sphingopyxis terrae]|uniref:hypothetical protein n=1 Tax=Sphingopyxis terrae TaxID=33052 RepID=UPI003F7D9A26
MNRVSAGRGKIDAELWLQEISYLNGVSQHADHKGSHSDECANESGNYDRLRAESLFLYGLQLAVKSAHPSIQLTNIIFHACDRLDERFDLSHQLRELGVGARLDGFEPRAKQAFVDSVGASGRSACMNRRRRLCHFGINISIE